MLVSQGYVVVFPFLYRCVATIPLCKWAFWSVLASSKIRSFHTNILAILASSTLHAIVPHGTLQLLWTAVL